MRVDQYLKTLDPNQSYWLADEGDVERLNDVEPTAENLCIVYMCGTCSAEEEVYHVIPYTDLKVDEDGDYMVCCKNDKRGEYETWIFKDSVPVELQTLFNGINFETYVYPEDED